MDDVEIKKSNVINDDMFQKLSDLNPKIAENMIRTQFRIRGFKKGNTIKMKEALLWLEQNSEGLIYIKDNSKSAQFDYLILFENEEDAVTFKLQWLS